MATVTVVDAMELSVRLSPGPESPAYARRVVDETFDRWGCGTLAADARVIVSELVTNAVRHARTAVELVLELGPTELRIAVNDEAVGGDVAVHAASTTATRGRGLGLVEGLADRWGVEHRAHGRPGSSGRAGKTVWAAWDLPL